MDACRAVHGMTDPRKPLLDLVDEISEVIEQKIKVLCVALGHCVMDDQCNKPEHRLCVYCGEVCPNAEVSV